MRDLRYALRTLRKSPGFAATAILTLALGIGASTAVFTIVDSVVLKPLAYRDSGRLVVAWERVRFLGGEPVGPNPRHVDVWQKRATAFSGLSFFRHMTMGLALDAQSPRVVDVVVSPANLFEILQVQALRGRVFLPEDGRKGHDSVAVLTYSLWQELFQGDPNVIGRKVRIDDVPRRVIGVLPADFLFPNANGMRAAQSRQAVSGALEPTVFCPLSLDVTQFTWNGNYGNWITIGRLKPEVTVGQAEAQLATISSEIVQEMPAGQGDHRPGALLAFVQPMQEAMVGSSRTGLWLLMAAVMGLMLIACLNLANAQLGRALSRCREAAVRSALGATKWRLLWNSLAENLIVAVVGGGAGMALAAAGLNAFRRYSLIDLPRLGEVHLNRQVMLFSVLLTIGASLLFGLLPAARLMATDPQSSLQQGSSRALGSRQSRRLRSWLIGLQVFGCTALLLVTGLFAKSLLNLLGREKGFETANVAVAEVRLTPQTYGSDKSRVAFCDGVLGHLRTLPGVMTASLISAMPLEGESWITGLKRADKPGQETPLINIRWIGPGYFEATGQKLLAGRFLEERDRNTKGVVISEREAKAVWGSENPIGGQILIEGRTFNVVGVVVDSRNASLKSAPPRMAYVHYQDQPPYAIFFLVRTAGSADSVLSGMRQAIWSYAPAVTVARVKTLDSQLNDSLAPERFQTLVLVWFGTAALLLAMLGIYGVLSYSVVTRKQEIGVRMALGATRSRVYRLTLAEAGAPVFAGLAAGLGGSLLAGRVVRNLLYGVEVVDLPVIVMVSVLFLVSAAVAAFVPARRAASVDPMEALRSE